MDTLEKSDPDIEVMMAHLRQMAGHMPRGEQSPVILPSRTSAKHPMLISDPMLAQLGFNQAAVVSMESTASQMDDLNTRVLSLEHRLRASFIRQEIASLPPVTALIADSRDEGIPLAGGESRAPTKKEGHETASFVSELKESLALLAASSENNANEITRTRECLGAFDAAVAELAERAAESANRLKVMELQMEHQREALLRLTEQVRRLTTSGESNG